MKSRIYYKYKGFRGIRYFMMIPDSMKAIQICLSTGTDQGRGRGNNIGIYIIDRLTIVSNYFHSTDLRPCRKSEYDKSFKNLLKLINP